MPELSIIVPVYKVEKYLPKCIDSILAQTFTDFELILIDDGSPDRCGEICDEYAARDSRIRVVHQENQGVSAARNAGLDIAAGTYLGFVDSDDWIEPEMYETMIAAAKEKNVDIVVTGLQYIDEKQNTIIDTTSSNGELNVFDSVASLKLLFGDSKKTYYGALYNKLYRRDLFQNIRLDSKISLFEDWLCNLKILLNKITTIYLSFSFYHYKIDTTSGLHTCTNPSRINQSMRVFYRILPQYLSLDEELDRIVIARFLEDSYLYSLRIHKVQRVSFSVFMIKTRMAIILFKAKIKKQISPTQFHKYLYEGIIKA